MGETAIAEYALISDCHSAALVSSAGSIDWLCRPRFDSPSIFGRLLDPSAGHFSIALASEFTATRRYLERTMVLETTFSATDGTAVVIDAMALDPTEHGHDLGAGAPRVLFRRILCNDGEVPILVEFAPRPEYGLISPLLIATPDGVASRGGALRSLLSTDRTASIDGSTATFEFTLKAGESASFALQSRLSFDADQPQAWSQDQIASGIDGTVEAWRTWSGVHQNYEGPWEDLVYHSGRVLQALMYQPTGAIVAAPTTSLPEEVGGERNWDYRYAWVRDASFTLDALWVAACPDEALKFFSWMTGAVASQISPNEPSHTCPDGGTAGRSGSATARGTSASWTCTGSCWTRRTACATSSRRSTTPPGPSWFRWPTRPPPGGRSRTRASGRSGANRGTSSTRS
nr:Glycosyl hydrolases family 15 [uncultured bacterium]